MRDRTIATLLHIAVVPTIVVLALIVMSESNDTQQSSTSALQSPQQPSQSASESSSTAASVATHETFESKLERKNAPWYSINLARMQNASEQNRSLFLDQYVESPTDCSREENPSELIEFRSGPQGLDSRERFESSVTENEVFEGVPIDITFNSRGQTSYIQVRYIRGQSFCREILQSLVQPYAIAIQAELDQAKREADRYR